MCTVQGAQCISDCSHIWFICLKLILGYSCPNICLSVVISFPRLAYLATRSSTCKSLLCLPSINGPWERNGKSRTDKYTGDSFDLAPHLPTIGAPFPRRGKYKQVYQLQGRGITGICFNDAYSTQCSVKIAGLLNNILKVQTRLAAHAAAVFNEIFSGRQPRVKI